MGECGEMYQIQKIRSKLAGYLYRLAMLVAPRWPE